MIARASILAVTAIAAAAWPLNAAVAAPSDRSMICKSPRQEYLLTYNDGAAAVVINPEFTAIEWLVLARQRDDRLDTLVVNFGAPSMTGVVHFRPYQMVEIFDSGELVQTDACHS